MARNLLLMLSSTEPPPPREEMAWHAAQSAKGAVTYVATTRRIAAKALVRGESAVAFYGDAASLENAYLGHGVFEELVDAKSPRGRQLLKKSGLYSKQGYPAKTRGLIGLRSVVAARPKADLAALKGTIESSRLALQRANLPEGAARFQLYFTTPRSLSKR